MKWRWEITNTMTIREVENLWKFQPMIYLESMCFGKLLPKFLSIFPWWKPHSCSWLPSSKVNSRLKFSNRFSLVSTFLVFRIYLECYLICEIVFDHCTSFDDLFWVSPRLVIICSYTKNNLRLLEMHSQIIHPCSQENWTLTGKERNRKSSQTKWRQ